VGFGDNNIGRGIARELEERSGREFVKTVVRYLFLGLDLVLHRHVSQIVVGGQMQRRQMTRASTLF
jgi:hypothetical protein